MKITLRELLLLTLIVALALGWWLDHFRLSTRLETYHTVLNLHGLLKNSTPIAMDFFGNLEGLVTAVGETGLVEVSIGDDDGLKTGQVLQVVRDDKHLGEIIIMSTSPDRAIGKIDPKTQRGEIQKGDRTKKTLSGR